MNGEIRDGVSFLHRINAVTHHTHDHTHDHTHGRRASKEAIYVDPISPEKLLFQNTLSEARRKNVQAMYNVAQLFIGAVEQKNKNVISLQILVSQLPQVKDK